MQSSEVYSTAQQVSDSIINSPLGQPSRREIFEPKGFKRILRSLGGNSIKEALEADEAEALAINEWVDMALLCEELGAKNEAMELMLAKEAFLKLVDEKLTEAINLGVMGKGVKAKFEVFDPVKDPATAMEAKDGSRTSVEIQKTTFPTGSQVVCTVIYGQSENGIRLAPDEIPEIARHMYAQSYPEVDSFEVIGDTYMFQVGPITNRLKHRRVIRPWGIVGTRATSTAIEAPFNTESLTDAMQLIKKAQPVLYPEE